MEEKLIKLILNLSTKWNMSPEKVVDRLNFMNESEINKTVKSMTKRFKSGGLIECLKAGGSVQDCGCGSKMVKKGAEGIPDLRYRESVAWMNDSNPNVRHKLGTFRQVGNVSAYEPTALGKMMGQKTDVAAINDIGYNESPKDYLDRWSLFTNRLNKEKILSQPNIPIRKGHYGMIVSNNKKKRRVDAAGYAWREKDGTAVLSRDAQGVRVPPGSSYVYENSTPPMRTEMRVKTDEGGRPMDYEFDVWNDNGDNNLSPVHRYGSNPKWFQFRRVKLTPEALEEKLEAFRKNGLLRSGGIINKKK